MDKEEAIERIAQSPYHQFLDLSVDTFEEGRIELHAPFRDEFRRDDSSIHGGVLASLIDIAATYATISAVDSGVPTVNLEVDYIRPTSPTDLVVEGTTIRAGSTIALARSEVRQEYEGRLTTVACGRGLFSTAHLD